MLERRLWPNFALLFLGLITCLSLWQMMMITPITTHSSQYNGVSFYTLNSANSSYVYPTESLPSDDYTTIMNLTTFHFEHISECQPSPLLLVLVHTSPANFDRRRSIRETWGHRRKDVKIVFILGTVNDLKLQEKLDLEEEKHRDFVQGSFRDEYRNMTYKHVMAFKFAIYHCPQAKYILKTDDDVFVNMPTMMDFLNEELSPYGARNLLFCTPLFNSPVMRSFRSKWRVSFQEYRSRYYPPYCPGWALLYSQDVLFALYKYVQKASFFWIDDVLITGLMAKKANIHHTSAEPYVLSSKTVGQIVHGASLNNSRVFLFGPPDLPIEHIYSLWDATTKNQTKSVLKERRWFEETRSKRPKWLDPGIVFMTK